jgi:hypothetical protein
MEFKRLKLKNWQKDIRMLSLASPSISLSLSLSLSLYIYIYTCTIILASDL